jgi:hypothetical protein
MRGLRDLVLRRPDVGSVMLSALVLVGFTGVFSTIAAFRLRFEETKTAWF